jgi:NodT family efflux transporter outer membrane factor (OMF) lipoprotein
MLKISRFPRFTGAAHRSASLPSSTVATAALPGAALLGLACLLSGCTVGPKYHAPAALPPTAPTATTYKEAPPAATQNSADAGDWKVAQPQDALLRGKWWEVFGDPELNALEDRLNIDNQTIKQYFQNFMESRAIVREAQAALYPTLGTNSTYTRSKSSGNLGNAISGSTAGSEASLGALPLTASWAPDLWGKIRNTIHSDQYSSQVSAADLAGERLTEQAALAEYFFEIRAQDALIRVLTDTVAADQKALDLTQSLYETGVDDQISVVEARTTLQGAQATLTGLSVARAQYEHAIATLIGTDPSTFSMPVRPATPGAPPIPIGLPSQLLERRPDVAGAERTMAAANAEIGIAYAAYYPSLTLSATGGFEASSWSKLFTWPSRFWSIGPSVSETFYDGGLRRATVNQYIATYNADVAGYRQTVLTAFQQVEDSLAGVRILTHEIEQEQQAVASAQQYVTLATGRYETGVDPYLNVLTAQTTLLADQQTLVTLQMQQMVDAVELVQALGGGWDRSDLPSTKQVTAKPTAADTTIQK